MTGCRSEGCRTGLHDKEVSMMKERLNRYSVVRYKWLLLAKLAVILSVGISGYVLAITMLDRTMPAAASYASESPRNFERAEPAELVKTALVKWMKLKSGMPEEVLSSIYDAARTNSNMELILAICMVESSFNPLVESSQGAVGLMGIMPSVWFEELKENGILKEEGDLYLVPNNIASGIYVFEKYLTSSGNLEKALFNYVGGDSEYVRKVLQTLGEIYHVKVVNSPGSRPNAAAGAARAFPGRANSG